MIVEAAKPSRLSISGLKQGDKAEFARLVEQYSNQVYRLALKMLGNVQEAEDVVQTTFLNAMNAVKNFEGRSHISTWLYRIAMNEALMILRKRKPEMLSTDEEVEDEDGLREPLQISDWCCLPEKELMAGETKKFLDDAIQRLSTSLRAVFTLRDIEGLSIKETARALGLTEATVKTRLLRARLKLREYLSRYFSERMEVQ